MTNDAPDPIAVAKTVVAKWEAIEAGVDDPSTGRPPSIIILARALLAERERAERAEARLADLVASERWT